MKNRFSVIAATAIIGVCSAAHAADDIDFWKSRSAVEYCEYYGNYSETYVLSKKRGDKLGEKINYEEDSALSEHIMASEESRRIAMLTQIYHTDRITATIAHEKYRAQCLNENWYDEDIGRLPTKKPLIDTKAAGDVIAYIIWFVMFTAISGFIYFLPTIIASRRKKRNTVAIFALNFLLGWTLVGWAVALVWALAYDVTGVYAPRGEPS
jgi:Superinfection immunity protein